MAIVFLQHPPATSIRKLIYLRHDKMKINLKLNKLKLLPYQCKRLLNIYIIVCIDPTNHVFQRYFFAFCVVEEIPLVVKGDEAILELIIFYVVNCY